MSGEKKEKNRKRAALRNVLIALLAVIVLSTVIVAYADDWEGWTEEKIEEAWNMYAITEWNNVSNLNFSISSNGSIASANVPDNFRSAYEGIVEDVLTDCSLTTVYYDSDDNTDKTAYKELLLAMGYILYQKGITQDAALGTLEDDITAMADVCYVQRFVTTTYTIDDAYDSFYSLFRRYVLAERNYCSSNVEGAQSYSIYSNDEYLACVIQGTLYGYKYCKENETYTTSNASDYYNENSDSILVKWNDYAEDVQGIYSAVRSNSDHTVVG